MARKERKEDRDRDEKILDEISARLFYRSDQMRRTGEHAYGVYPLNAMGYQRLVFDRETMSRFIGNGAPGWNVDYIKTQKAARELIMSDAKNCIAHLNNIIRFAEEMKEYYEKGVEDILRDLIELRNVKVYPR